MKQMPKMLKQVSAVRCVGFADAVRDLGKHEYCGRMVDYNPCTVRKVLTGEHHSEKLLKLIAEKRPDLFDLYFVADEVREWYADHKCWQPVTPEEQENRYRERQADIVRDEED